MVFYCGFVVGFCGVDLVIERAEVDSFSVDADSGAPSLHVPGPVDTLVLRAGGPVEFSSVPDILGVCCGPQVRLAIVQAVVIDMVAEHPVRDVDNKVVHLNIFSGCVFAVGQRVNGVPCVRALVGVPFVLHQALVISRIDDGILALRQRDFPIGVAAAQTTI